MPCKIKTSSSNQYSSFYVPVTELTNFAVLSFGNQLWKSYWEVYMQNRPGYCWSCRGFMMKYFLCGESETNSQITITIWDYRKYGVTLITRIYTSDDYYCTAIKLSSYIIEWSVSKMSALTCLQNILFHIPERHIFILSTKHLKCHPNQFNKM